MVLIMLTTWRYMDIFPNRLNDFMSKPRHTKGRESLLMKRLTYDLQLSAAINGAYLMAYDVDVDHNGYDLILDTEMVSKKIQVKSKNVNSKTSSWHISKGLLRPSLPDMMNIPFWNTLGSGGISGGVILKIFTVNNTTIDMEYYYTDLRILTLKHLSIIGNEKTKIKARKALIQLMDGDFHDKIELRLSHFVKVNKPEFLLPLMGLNSRYCPFQWIHFMYSRYHKKGERNYIAPKEYLDEQIKSDLNMFCDTLK